MQRISTSGADMFALYKRDSPPLVLTPIGRCTAIHAAEIKAARERGPAQITKLAHGGSTAVATFDGGSVVRTQMLRSDAETASR